MTGLRTLRAALWLLAARAWLVLTPRRALAWRRPVPHPSRTDLETAAQFALAVQRAARHLPFRPTCLEQALALERLLRSEGLDAAVVVGVRRARATLDAHAWLEHQGRTLLGATPGRRYETLHRTNRT